MGVFPPPAPFVVATDVDATTWIDERLQPFGRLGEGTLVGEIVPSGFEAYARVFHPARRVFGPSIEQRATLRWSEIAAARNKTVHPQNHACSFGLDPVNRVSASRLAQSGIGACGSSRTIHSQASRIQMQR